MKYLNNVDLNLNQLLNGLLQNLGADPSPAATSKGLVWFNTASGLAKVWDGSAVSTLTNLLESVTGSGAISVSAVSGKSQTISIAAASASVPGTMSAADYSLLHTATSVNTASAIVQRDASGNFAAGTITASLTGTASNATQLNGQAASYYLARANATGTQTASTISDLATTVQGYSLSQFAAPTAAVPFNSQKITGLADPTNPQDAATKNYVDATSAGFDVKASVRAASTGNVVVASGLTTGTVIDGVTLATGDRVLLKNQTTASENGIYVVAASGAASRSSDANANSGTGASALNPGSFVFVEQGTTNAATAWVLGTQGPITVGTTALAFSQVGSSTAYTAGNGLSLVGSQFAVVGTTNRIVSSGSGVDISPNYIGQTSITTLGVVGTGTWQGNAVGIAYGGTGATSAAAARANLGVTGKYAPGSPTIGDGSSTSITVTHNLNTLDVVVALFQASDGAEVFANVTHSTVNTITLSFSVAPAANSLRVVVVG
jgi:hypothetical protein